MISINDGQEECWHYVVSKKCDGLKAIRFFVYLPRLPMLMNCRYVAGKNETHKGQNPPCYVHVICVHYTAFLITASYRLALFLSIVRFLLRVVSLSCISHDNLKKTIAQSLN